MARDVIFITRLYFHGYHNEKKVKIMRYYHGLHVQCMLATRTETGSIEVVVFASLF